MEDHTAPNVTKIGVSNNPERREREVWMVTTRARYEVADRYIANLIESMAQALQSENAVVPITIMGNVQSRHMLKATPSFSNALLSKRWVSSFGLYQLFQKLGYDALRSYRRKFCRIHGIHI